jgi:hypothetical protein
VAGWLAEGEIFFFVICLLHDLLVVYIRPKANSRLPFVCAYPSSKTFFFSLSIPRTTVKMVEKLYVTYNDVRQTFFCGLPNA